MMLEIVEPPDTYLEIIRAALIPRKHYNFSLLMQVNIQWRRIGAVP
jgi:hypothetical protein